MQQKLKILIVGAGISGLTAAIALRRAGHEVTVFEQSLMKKEVGAALTITPNATRVLLSLGLDLQKARTVPWDTRLLLLVDSNSTREAGIINMKAVADAYGFPCVCSHRVDLHDALKLLAVSEEGFGVPVRVIPGTRAISADTKAASITLEDGSTYSGDVVIGADGVHSKMRPFVVGNEELPLPSTTTVMRFTVPSDTIRSDPVLAPLLEGKENTLRGYLIPNDDNRYLLQYPCRDNTLQNFVVYDLNDTESFTAEQWNMLSTREHLLHRLRGFNTAITALAQVADEVLPLWKCLDREPIPKLYRDGLVLIGDAAHPMYPHLGQGAAMGIEDAGCLGVLFEHCDSSQVSERLELFQLIRHNRVSAAQIMSRVKTTASSLTEVEELYRGYFDSGAYPKDKLETAHWLFNYDFVQDASKALQSLEQKRKNDQ